ncbi:glycoside hydrolase family 76 protein [Massilibacteroides sp.]|uniref:glycoside hydrolase family 76 protein n=1 Tax=Massilibacteroides sp. TaxID=2034766 RepID=UPI00260C45CB|nr:glycoside hydrolase family 76 protein [Massilibacteroides sp.]MDD4516198.1 glycoside hydrolase family 76 protein [Massilibacteroides sp.]
MKKLFILPLLLLFFSCDEDYPYDPGTETVEIDWNTAANEATNSLISNFWNEAGYFNYGSNESDTGFQYWPNAHAMDVVVDAYERSGDEKYKAYFDKWYSGIKEYNGNTYYNKFYDDMEWIGLTLVRMYNNTKEEKYLNTAKELWTDISNGWNDEYAGGGVAWNKDELYSKNACSNGPASLLAAKLYQVTKEDTYKEWAIKIFEWQKNTLYEPSTGAVYDNINGQTDLINTVVLTYNQGTFMGTAIELYNITNDGAYLNVARKVASYTISKLIDTNSGILRNEGSGDNALFKGIFVRYYLPLVKDKELSGAYHTLYLTAFKKNTETLWLEGCYPQVLLFGPSWNEIPAGETQLTAQASACMTIEMRAAYENALK